MFLMYKSEGTGTESIMRKMNIKKSSKQKIKELEENISKEMDKNKKLKRANELGADPQQLPADLNALHEYFSA